VTGVLHIVLARKPLEGTIAENCLQWGCGALWIDGTRIAGKWSGSSSRQAEDITGGSYAGGQGKGIADLVKEQHLLGRFPANLILGGEEVVEGFPETHGAGNTRPSGITAGNSIFGIGSNGMRNPKIPGDCGGSASRFFFNFSEQESDE